jgi:hypothetical protein
LEKMSRFAAALHLGWIPDLRPLRSLVRESGGGCGRNLSHTLSPFSGRLERSGRRSGIQRRNLPRNGAKLRGASAHAVWALIFSNAADSAVNRIRVTSAASSFGGRNPRELARGVTATSIWTTSRSIRKLACAKPHSQPNQPPRFAELDAQSNWLGPHRDLNIDGRTEQDDARPRQSARPAHGRLTLRNVRHTINVTQAMRAEDAAPPVWRHSSNPAAALRPCVPGRPAQRQRRGGREADPPDRPPDSRRSVRR